MSGHCEWKKKKTKKINYRKKIIDNHEKDMAIKYVYARRAMVKLTDRWMYNSHIQAGEVRPLLTADQQESLKSVELGFAEGFKPGADDRSAY